MNRTIAAERTHLSCLLSRLGTTPFVYTSGTGIYGAGEWVSDEQYPTDPFERSRRDLLAERMILDAVTEGGVRATVLRPAPIYGPGGLFDRFWGSRLATGRRTMYAGNGNQLWSLVSVWDCARAYLAAIDTPTDGEVFNVTDDEPVRIRTFLSALAAEMGAPGPIGVPKPLFRLLAGPVLAPPMVSSFPANNDRIRERLGFDPEHPTYREGVTAVASAYADDRPQVVESGGRSRAKSASSRSERSG